MSIGMEKTARRINKKNTLQKHQTVLKPLTSVSAQSNPSTPLRNYHSRLNRTELILNGIQNTCVLRRANSFILFDSKFNKHKIARISILRSLQVRDIMQMVNCPRLVSQVKVTKERRIFLDVFPQQDQLACNQYQFAIRVVLPRPQVFLINKSLVLVKQNCVPT